MMIHSFKPVIPFSKEITYKTSRKVKRLSSIGQRQEAAYHNHKNQEEIIYEACTSMHRDNHKRRQHIYDDKAIAFNKPLSHNLDHACNAYQTTQTRHYQTSLGFSRSL